MAHLQLFHFRASFQSQQANGPHYAYNYHWSYKLVFFWSKLPVKWNTVYAVARVPTLKVRSSTAGYAHAGVLFQQNVQTAYVLQFLDVELIEKLVD